MKMSNNPAKYEVLIKQYLHSILDSSVVLDLRYSVENFFVGTYKLL